MQCGSGSGIEQEDAGRLHRERKRLVQERVQHVNRIKALCALHGIYDYQPLRGDRQTQREGQRTGDGRPQPARLKAEIMRELQRLEQPEGRREAAANQLLVIRLPHFG